jgi:hypothetical protein
MKEVPEKYKKLIRNLSEACKLLKWDFSTETDLVERWSMDDAIGFTIDKVEYFVSITTDEKSHYAAVMVQNHGSRHEPPSEDEEVLMDGIREKPENLLNSIIYAHWGVRTSWVAEHLAYLDEPEA